MVKTKTVYITVTFPDGYGFVTRSNSYHAEDNEYILGILSTQGSALVSSSLSSDGSTITVSGQGESAKYPRTYTVVFSYLELG